MRPRTSVGWLVPIGCVALLLARPGIADAQQVVLATLPAAVSFDVADVSTSTPGSAPTTAVFTVLSLLPWNAVRISLRADDDFSSPGGPRIPASSVSWTTSNVSNGTGYDGTLGTATYTAVLQTSTGLLGTSRVDLDWTLAPPPAGVRAGVHGATVRWRVEALIP